MQRKEWFEFHDSRWYPAFLRNLVTDALEAIWRGSNGYGPVLPRLEHALNSAHATHIVDLCSGGGGPWPDIVDRVKGQTHLTVCLTDKYPNQAAFERAALQSKDAILYEPAPVDACRLPAQLSGFRTLFSSFHHFNPQQARAMLKDACEQQQGIAVFEAAKPAAWTMLFIFLVPLLCLLFTPRIRPFRWSRIFWTYLLPVIPLTLLVDGWLSCLRSYSVADMRELTRGLNSGGYCWECGIERSGKLGIQYLIGRPQAQSLRSATGATVGEQQELVASGTGRA